LASILENWRQKIKIGDFFGSNIFGARATPVVSSNHFIFDKESKTLSKSDLK
jgi:hypothetical protein